MKKLILLFIFLGLILGFCVNVNAVTGITVDTTTCLESDPGSCLIVDQSYISIIGMADNLLAYKTLDYYYNSSTNVMSYEFTSQFKDFLDSTAGTNNDYSTMTVEEYMKIVGATDEEMSQGSTQLKNDLDKLYSLYAVYVRKNSDSISGDSIYGLSAGSYLVFSSESYFRVYAVMVANLKHEVNEIGEWELNQVDLVSKYSSLSGDLFIAGLGEIGSMEYRTGTYNVGEEFDIFGVINIPKYPTNAVNKHFVSRDFFSSGIEIVGGVGGVKVEADGYIFENDGNGNVIDVETGEIVATFSYVDGLLVGNYDTDKILADRILLKGKAKLNSNAILGREGNGINVYLDYSNDPYGTSINTTSLEDILKIYTYGLKITLSDRDDDAIFLPGAVFEVYDSSDTEFKNVIGSITIGEDGNGVLFGLADGSYVLKQVKAASGYHINDDYTFTFSPDDIDDEGYYNISLTNQKYSLLPFTGGAGTLTYTLWGLIMISIAAVGFVIYRKKKQTSVEIETL